MSRIQRADWSASTPWSGLQDKPAFLDGPGGSITIADVIGLVAALAGKMPAGSLARVATTGNYNDLNHLPALGSAAFSNVSDFLTAPTASQLQTGEIALVAGTQSYDVAFSTTMASIPKVYTQVLMATVAGEIFSTVIEEDLLTTSGFRLLLSGVPSLSTGKVRWRATVETTPA